MFIHQDIMKKLASIIIGMLAAVAAYAQTPQDSTVYIVAYWQEGEKYAYEYSSEEYTIVNGDTTEVSYTNSIQIFEILEETETSYKISVSYMDEYSSDPLTNALNAYFEERGNDFKLIVTTDENGSIQGVENAREISDQILGSLDEIIDIMMKNDGDSAEAEEGKAFVKDYFKEIFGDPEIVASLFSEEIGRMLYFHGCGLELNQEYTGQIEVPSIFPGVDIPIPAELTIWVDPEYTDKYRTVCRAVTSISAEDLRNFVIEQATQKIKQAGDAGLDEESVQAAIDQVQNVVNAIECSMIEYITVENHASGWPLKVLYDKIVHVNAEGQDQYESTSWKMSLIIPNDEE